MNKLKEKLEKVPKYEVEQEITIKSKIYTFDLNPYINSSEIVDLCKKYHTDEYKNKEENILYGYRSLYVFPKIKMLQGFEKLLDVTTSKINNLSDRYSFFIHHFWFALYNTGDGANLHHHGDSEYACVYYARTPSNCAPLLIPTKNGDIEIQPTTGMLLVMSGYCMHSVPESHHNDGERIIVAMNAFKEKVLN